MVALYWAAALLVASALPTFVFAFWVIFAAAVVALGMYAALYVLWTTHALLTTPWWASPEEAMAPPPRHAGRNGTRLELHSPGVCSSPLTSVFLH